MNDSNIEKVRNELERLQAMDSGQMSAEDRYEHRKALIKTSRILQSIEQKPVEIDIATYANSRPPQPVEFVRQDSVDSMLPTTQAKPGEFVSIISQDEIEPRDECYVDW